MLQVSGGILNLIVLKTTNSSFEGFVGTKGSYQVFACVCVDGGVWMGGSMSVVCMGVCVGMCVCVSVCPRSKDLLDRRAHTSSVCVCELVCV